MKMARVILFTAQMKKMSKFYGEVLGLKQVTSEKGWQEFAAGGATLALHSGPSSPGRKGPKIAFLAKDVVALREKLVALGASFWQSPAGRSVLPLRRQRPGRQSHSTFQPVTKPPEPRFVAQSVAFHVQ